MALAYQTVASAASGTCNKPTGTASGDTLTAAVFGVGGTTAASLAGWTQQATTNASGFVSLTILTKIAGGSEPASYTFTGPPLVGATIIVRASGGDTSAVIDGTPTTSTTATVGSITTTSANSLLVMATVGGSDTTGTSIAPDAAMTERAELADGFASYGSLEVATEARASAGATGTRTSTDAAASGFLTAMVAIKEASAATVVDAPAMAASYAMGTPTNALTQRLDAPAMAASYAMGTPTDAITQRVDAPAMSATYAMGTPTYGIGATGDAPAMAATYAMDAPTNAITQRGDAPAMNATYAMGTPTSATTLDAPALAATWDMGVPTYGLGAPVDAPAMAATYAMGAPTLTLSQVVDAPPMTFDLAMGDPTFSLTQRVDAPAMGAVWAMGEVTGGASFPGVAWDGRAVVRRSGVRGSLHLTDPIDGDYGGVPGPVRGRRGNP